LFGRAAFVVAAPFGESAALVTRLIAAGVIGAVGAYLFGRTAAIPDQRARLILAFSLPLFPIPDPGPYIGPLNSQWWFAIAFAGIALSAPKRWHYPALVLGGLSGIGPCLLWPAFRDRRIVALLIPAIIQAVVLFQSDRVPKARNLDLGYVILVLVLAAALVFARLPLRTRLVFLYAGVAILAIGFYAEGRLVGRGRYLAIPQRASSSVWRRSCRSEAGPRPRTMPSGGSRIARADRTHRAGRHAHDRCPCRHVVRDDRAGSHGRIGGD
jgi:hypothetical protein